ncbi:hypothetical protein BD414DRAFT_299179 [Trametes punicea]|nr:hypothetical protein BD414DRAFT_299179 [Trametes punicea]
MYWLYGYRLCSFMLALGLGIGVVALGVQTLTSWGFVLVDSKKDFDVLYAGVGIVVGIVTVMSTVLKLIADSCHRPVPIIIELVWLPMLSVSWVAVAIMTAVENGRNFRDAACDDEDAIANGICVDVGPIIGLSAAVSSTLLLYWLVLLLVAVARARRGTAIWTSPVLKDKGFKTSGDLEADNSGEVA